MLNDNGGTKHKVFLLSIIREIFEKQETGHTCRKKRQWQWGHFVDRNKTERMFA